MGTGAAVSVILGGLGLLMMTIYLLNISVPSPATAKIAARSGQSAGQKSDPFARRR